MVKKIFAFCLSIGLLLTLAACGEGTARAGTENKGWPKKLILVQMPNENNPNVASLHNQLRDHLSKKLDMEVEEYQGGSYAVGIEAMASGKLDVMLVSPMSFYQAQQLADAELLVTPKSETAQYYTSFITKSDNTAIQSLEDLKGTNFAFVNAASSSGYLYPKATLVQEFDLQADLVEQSGYFFDNVVFSESHPNSLMGVAMGDYEAAAVAGSVVEMMVEAGNIEEGAIKEIGRTMDIPDASYAIRGDLPEDFKKAVQDAFESFEDEAYFEALHSDPKARFLSIDNDYYNSTIEMLDAINALKGE